MPEFAVFDWHDAARQLSGQQLAGGRFTDLPPHVRQRVLAVLNPAELILGYVDVDLDRARSATGSAVFVTTNALVLVSLDAVPRDGNGSATDVQVRFFAEVVRVAVTGSDDGWAPDQWREPPTGQYRLTFADGTQVGLPPAGGTITNDLRALVVGLPRRR